jgi:hypothetical protein
MRKTIIFLIVIVLTLCSCGKSNKPPEYDESGVRILDEDSLLANALDKAPVLVESVDLSANDLQQIGNNLGGVELESGKNEFYSVNGESVQLNSLMPVYPVDLMQLNGKFTGLVGNVNSIVMGSDRIYEIIAADPYEADAVRAILDIDFLQKFKLITHSAYGELTVLTEVGGDMPEYQVQETDGTIHLAVLLQGVKGPGEEFNIVYSLMADEWSATEEYQKLMEVYDEGQVQVIGNVVVTVFSDDWRDQQAIFRCLTIPVPSKNESNRFLVRLSLVPVTKIDYMQMNNCFNLLLNGAEGSNIRQIDPTIVFGDTLPLFMNNGTSQLESDLNAEGIILDDSITISQFNVQTSSTRMNTIDLILNVKSLNVINSNPGSLELYKRPNDFWPVENSGIQAAVDDALRGLNNPSARDKVNAIHNWMRENIEYGGEIAGSRYGVETVMSQGYGHCWDLSDVFVTMARASGLASRQIGGWIYGGEGHIWAQVYLEDEHVWMDVDVTNDGPGINGYYIPIFGTLNGEMPYLYADMPIIERIDPSPNQ